MAVELAAWLVRALTGYAILGVLFAGPFLRRGVSVIDPAAQGGSVGFRVMILPGVVALWPLLLTRWMRGRAEPPEEQGAHREAARQSTTGAGS